MINVNQMLLSKEEIISLTQLFASAKKIIKPNKTSFAGAEEKSRYQKPTFVFDIPYVKPVKKHVIQSLLESAGFYTNVIQDPPQWHAYREERYAMPGKLIFQAESKEKAMFAIMKQMTDANKAEVLAHIDTLDFYSRGTEQHEDDYYIFPNIMYSDD